MFDIILQKGSEINIRVINGFWTVFFVCFQKPGLGHNMLDSSAPLKRGKERENPKPKKPSSLKKVRPHSPFIECYVIETKKSQNLLKKKVMSPSWTNIKKKPKLKTYKKISKIPFNLLAVILVYQNAKLNAPLK